MTWRQSWLRLTGLKILGLVLALVFFSLAALTIGYPALSAVVNAKGVAAKVSAVKGMGGSPIWVHRHWGAYSLSVWVEKQKYEKIYVLYPQWPGHWAPRRGDDILVWPPDHPRFAAVATDGWGWLILGSVLILGFLFLEFGFLSLSLR
ncbi:MAG: hypothetical protein ACREL1_06890 [bacterium]